MEKPSNLESRGWIRRLVPEMAPPSLKNNTADTDRLIHGIEKALPGARVRIGLDLIRPLAGLLREENYRVQTLLWNEGGAWRVMDVTRVDGNPPPMGLAVDLGTSTVVLRLVDLETGAALEERSFLNPQVAIGQDILTRIHSAARPGGLERLRSMLLETLNGEIQDLTVRNNLRRRSIVGVCIAGNTTMSHLFLGLDPQGLCREPYIPVVNRTDILEAGELGLGIHPRAPVLVFPNVGSYFGGDLVAGILASGMNEGEDVSLFVDIGTNAEVVLGNRDWLMVCAGAAGPALEGGVAQIGMMASPGAISRVRIDAAPDRVHIETLGGKPPIGICGSGLIDLVAQLFLAGMIDLRGKFVQKACGDRLLDRDGDRRLLIVPARESGTGRDLTLRQTDIDSLIRSKAAMYTILVTITRMVNLNFGDIQRFNIAGTFGTYIDPRSAVTLGMIPDLPLTTYRSLGNTSLEGATRALLSRNDRDEIDIIRGKLTYVELNVNQEFMNRFSAAKFIPHTNSSLFPSVKAPAEGG